MDTRLLLTFTTVVELGSFSDAAASLGFTQSAVSQHVAALEREVGTALLNRRPVAPTAAGEQFLRHARQLLAASTAATAAALRAAGATASSRAPHVTLSPGAVSAGAIAWLPLGLRGAAVRQSGEAVARLVAGNTDIVIVDAVTAPSDPLPLAMPDGVAVRIARESPLVVLLPASHPLAGVDGVDLPALGAARWIDADSSSCPTSAVAATARESLRIAVDAPGATDEVVVGLVAAGHGIACLPFGRQRLGALHAGTTAVPLRNPALTHRVEVWTHEVDRPAVTEAATQIGDTAANAQREGTPAQGNQAR